jgi:hypothetical protein
VTVVVLALASCSGDPGDDAGAGASGTTAPPPTAPADPDRPRATPARHVGPQGRVGQFVVHCDYSHSGDHDPIVHFGHEGRSHRHDFYGSDIIDSETSAHDLLEGGTTCDKRADKAGYWQPTLYDHGEVVEPTAINAYYRAAPGVTPTDVQTMPVGLAMIAGDQTATEPQEGEAVGWVCGTQTRLRDEPPECPGTAPLRLVLTFQDCWDGEHLEAADFQSHVAYSTDGTCPASHPVHIPQITVSIGFPITGPGHDLTLASGNVYSAHGDFFNAWEPDGLLREIERCIHRDVVCDLASNRAEEPLFTG